MSSGFTRFFFATVNTRLACLEMIGKLSGELRSGAAEIIPAVAGAAAAAQASVTVNLPPPPAPKNWNDLDGLLRQIYNLGPRAERKTPHPDDETPIM